MPLRMSLRGRSSRGATDECVLGAPRVRHRIGEHPGLPARDNWSDLPIAGRHAHAQTRVLWKLSLGNSSGNFGRTDPLSVLAVARAGLPATTGRMLVRPKGAIPRQAGELSLEENGAALEGASRFRLDGPTAGGGGGTDGMRKYCPAAHGFAQVLGSVPRSPVSAHG
jgi:hypothetical protein